jgi:hypothetical protein
VVVTNTPAWKPSRVVSRFARKVRTASGAAGVQIVTRRGRQVERVQHLGSAHTDAELALLLAAARERVLPGQDTLDLADASAVPARAWMTSRTGRPTVGGRRPSRCWTKHWQELVARICRIPCGGGAACGPRRRGARCGGGRGSAAAGGAPHARRRSAADSECSALTVRSRIRSGRRCRRQAGRWAGSGSVRRGRGPGQ